MKELFKQNGHSLEFLNASNCLDAITDETLADLCAIEEPVLKHLDISYCKLVTDAGLQHFEGKTFSLHTLNVTGLIGVTGLGLYHPIFSSNLTLKIYIGGLMN